jgi:hypothetical protein
MVHSLKGQSHEIFDPRFFSSIKFIGSLIHGLKYFCIWFRIRREIREYVLTLHYAGIMIPHYAA